MTTPTGPSASATRLAIWITVAALVPALGVLGWVASRLLRAPNACPLCDAVKSGDVARVRQAVADGGAVTPDAWHTALEIARGTPDTDGPGLAIVETLLDHGADPNDFWTPSRQYVASLPTSTSVRLGSVSAASGGQAATSRRRIYAAEVAVLRSADAALIRRFLARGLDVTGKGAGEALVSASRHERLPALQALLDAGVPPNYVTADAPRRTALAEAIQTLDLALIAALEAKGAIEWP